MSGIVFEHQDYKEYLNERLSTQGESRGARTRLALALNCQTAFISQVLNGAAHFSFEHAILIDQFLKHSEMETEFFMLLVGLGRSGTPKLKDYYQGRLKNLSKSRELIGSRIEKKKVLSIENQIEYYKSWMVSAIHVLISIPAFQTSEKIANRLGLSLETVQQALNFLVREGLVRYRGASYELTERRIHLPKDSMLISKHHTNWRIRAIQSLESELATDLHFSGTYTLAEKDVVVIRDLLLSMIEKADGIIRKSPEETVIGIGIDFFKL